MLGQIYGSTPDLNSGMGGMASVGSPRVKPHGMSLTAKPDRTPHPVAPGRDVHGRILPMPKVKASKVNVNAVVTKTPIVGKPIAAPAMVKNVPAPKAPKFTAPPTSGRMIDRIPQAGRSNPFGGGSPVY